jgi:hypothetical protein
LPSAARAIWDGAEKAYRARSAINPVQDAAWDQPRAARLPQLAAVRTSSRASLCHRSEPGGARAPQSPSSMRCSNRASSSQAAAEAKKVLKADERNVRAMQLLAQVYLKEGKVELVASCSRTRVTSIPNDATTQNAWGSHT